MTSDGSLWGSFAVWGAGRRRARGSIGGSVGGGRNGSVNEEGGRRLVRARSVMMSGSGDSVRLAAEQARVRLERERDERLEALKRKMERRGRKRRRIMH
jgi:hypothetical protein